MQNDCVTLIRRFFVLAEQQERLKQAEQAEKEKLRKFKQQIQSKLDTLVGTESEIKIQFEPMDNFFRNVVWALLAPRSNHHMRFKFQFDFFLCLKGMDWQKTWNFEAFHLDSRARIVTWSCTSRNTFLVTTKLPVWKGAKHMIRKRWKNAKWVILVNQRSRCSSRVFHQLINVSSCFFLFFGFTFGYKRKKEAEENELKNAKQRSKVEIASTYQDKYKHLIGNEAGKSAAQIATPNSSFGVGKSFVFEWSNS